MSAYECSLRIMSDQVLDSKKQKLVSFKITSPYHFANYSVKIAPNDKKLILFSKIYAERAVEKCITWKFVEP